MLDSEKRLNVMGQLMLIVATMIWGTSFFILKNTLDTLPVMFVLAVRFLTSAIILFIVFYKRVIKIKKRRVASRSHTLR
jgi:drug/metabolite transporter (DMT)-like permease